jgi:hypothetical protein
LTGISRVQHAAAVERKRLSEVLRYARELQAAATAAGEA